MNHKGNDIYNESFTSLLIKYSEVYKRNGKVFINSFLKFKSVRSACSEIIKVMKETGVFGEAEKTGKDFSGYAEKFNIQDKDKKTLSDILLLIYAVTK